MNRHADLWLALALLSFCVFAAVLTTGLSTVGTGTWAGPSFFPWLMIGGIALLSIALALRTLVTRQRQPQEGARTTSVRLAIKLALFFLLMVAYAAFYVQTGYIISTAAFFIIAMLVLGERKVLHFAVIPLGIILSVYLVFTQIIKVYLP
ncbi:tripartite tricarboxylate transporter TctB family protein [Shumkonia mesophila]|uniref:tripartite tricarboxylate transporter TctB family protein n=1 Tax=Shumkonia mesophila TaxID=2838854 RepID=UPI002934D07C|nr:tripartite tricarboxylate transporter TctB family protein [Shumkonia mesophila]